MGRPEGQLKVLSYLGFILLFTFLNVCHTSVFPYLRYNSIPNFTASSPTSFQLASESLPIGMAKSLAKVIKNCLSIIPETVLSHSSLFSQYLSRFIPSTALGVGLAAGTFILGGSGSPWRIIRPFSLTE